LNLSNVHRVETRKIWGEAGRGGCQEWKLLERWCFETIHSASYTHFAGDIMQNQWTGRCIIMSNLLQKCQKNLGYRREKTSTYSG
jgi:hypothetical protein